MPKRNRYRLMEAKEKGVSGWHIVDLHSGKRAAGTRFYGPNEKDAAFNYTQSMNNRYDQQQKRNK